MKIAQVGTLYENIPPPMYGGTERIISSLTEGLVKNGHDVTLFATEKAITKAKLIPICEKPLSELGITRSNIMYPLLSFSEVCKREKEFDIIHFHLSMSSDYISLLGSSFLPHKTIYTIHFASPQLKGYPDRAKVLDTHKNLNFVSISNNARKGYEHLNWIDTVYNGIEIANFAFNDKPKDYYAWLGKFNPDKGTKEAIFAAKKAGIKLILAGTIDLEDPTDRTYYEEEISPHIDGKQIQYIGEVGGEKKNEFLSNAKGFLNPILWEEPFGLVSVEAMAAGTPVISFKKGALSETINDGTTGFLVDTVDQMVEKIKEIQTIDRHACRQWVEEKFSAEVMVKNYETAYSKVLQFA